MVTRTVRKIVKIDEDKCTGCGACIMSCAEGALKIIDGKAKLVSEKYCDGLGNCLDCPEGAISIEEREAEEFDEAAVEEHMKAEEAEDALPCGCPSATVTQFEKTANDKVEAVLAGEPSGDGLKSRLGHWPVQLTLVPPNAPFLRGADVVLAADCVPFAYAGFHRDFLGDRALLVACPKLDDFRAHQEKLTEVLKQSGLKGLTIVRMEVPCCGGLVHMVKQAMLNSGNVVPFREVVIGIKGGLISG
jgi:NAD-dependent dihydropyrimidine dehydrogenase PreA subunit